MLLFACCLAALEASKQLEKQYRDELKALREQLVQVRYLLSCLFLVCMRGLLRVCARRACYGIHLMALLRSRIDLYSEDTPVCLYCPRITVSICMFVSICLRQFLVSFVFLCNFCCLLHVILSLQCRAHADTLILRFAFSSTTYLRSLASL